MTFCKTLFASALKTCHTCHSCHSCHLYIQKYSARISSSWAFILYQHLISASVYLRLICLPSLSPCSLASFCHFGPRSLNAALCATAQTILRSCLFIISIPRKSARSYASISAGDALGNETLKSSYPYALHSWTYSGHELSFCLRNAAGSLRSVSAAWKKISDSSFTSGLSTGISFKEKYYRHVHICADLCALLGGAPNQLLSAYMSAYMIHVRTLRDFKNTTKNQSIP